jgi:hypothetical protein
MEKLLKSLNDLYTSEPENFDFNASIYISGKDKEPVRIEILTRLAGGTRPTKSKSTYMHTVNALKNKFTAPEIEFC